jgi:hypothetical protein
LQWNYDTHTPEWHGEQHTICQAVSLPARNWAHDPVTTRHTQTHGWPSCEQTNKLTSKTKKRKTTRSTKHANKKHRGVFYRSDDYPVLLLCSGVAILTWIPQSVN